ncbi:MAG: hypothetical protein M4579_002996 [Chaenotheca gracillima]|nr:MAG: hypothetical protein M4579_002996 [Chaenotheca gracillima]
MSSPPVALEPFPTMSPFRHGARTDIDRHGAKRMVPMKVLCLGLSRTGTASLRQALKRLGYVDTYHGFETLTENPRDLEFWLEAENRRCGKTTGRKFTRADFDQVLGHCQAVSDIPCACFAEELIAAYPDAKIIYTTRDKEAWFKSMQNTLLAWSKHPSIKLIQLHGAIFGKPMRYVSDYLDVYFHGYFGGDFIANGRRVWDEHYDLVHSLAPPEKILDYQVKEGWGPLCEFLGDPVPNLEFPRVNDTDEFQRRLGKGANAGGNLVKWIQEHPGRILAGLGFGAALAGGVLSRVTELGFDPRSFSLGAFTK